MKKEQILDLMNAIPPDLIEEAGIQSPAKRRAPRLVHTGLIAACLCLALLGTAFAANPEAVAALIQRLTVSLVSAEDSPGYRIGGEMAHYPLSAFSPALNAASEGRESPASPVSLDFDTWDEVQAFLGEGIPCVWPGNWDGDFQVVLFHTELEKLWGIEIDSTDISRQATVTVRIYTEHWPDSLDSIAGLSAPPGSSFTQLDSYPMASGAAAEIIQYTSGDEHPGSTCTGYFTQGGILYEVTAHSPVPPQEDTAAQLHTILDSFPAAW